MPLTKPRTLITKPREGQIVVPQKAFNLGSYDYNLGNLKYNKGPENTALRGKPIYVRTPERKHGYYQAYGLEGGYANIQYESELRRAAPSERKEFVSQYLAADNKRFPFGKGEGYHGCDPELFIVDKDGQVVPAFIFLPSKEDAKEEQAHPHANTARDVHTKLVRKIFWDGFQAEFTTPRTFCFGWGSDYIQKGIHDIWRAAQKACPECKPSWKPVMDIPRDLLANSDARHVNLGCEPSKNAYTDDKPEKLEKMDPSKLTFRFAGFHIHFGIGRKSEARYKRIVKALDALVGCMSVSLFQGMEDIRRRDYYGLAGEYRTPTHGLEYRTLSSCVLASPYAYHLVNDTARAVRSLAESDFVHCIKADEKDVVKAINTLDVDLAKKIVNDNKAIFDRLWGGIYGDIDGHARKMPEKCMTLVQKGLKECVSTDMVAAWRLMTNWDVHSHDSKITICKLRF